MGSTEALRSGPDCREVALSPGDAASLVALSENAGWNQVASDWRFMLTQGSGVGVVDGQGRHLASALTWPVSPWLNWISMVLTRTDQRRRGFGTQLLQRCIAMATDGGCAAGLDATELGRPLYATMGFRDLYTLSRWRLEEAGAIAPLPSGIAIRPAMLDDVHALAAFDRRYSAMDREALLAHLIGRAPGVAQVALAGEAIRGYVLGRDGRTTAQIGPLLAEDDATALALLSRAVAASALPVMLDMPDRHQAIARWIAAQGGTAPRRFWRMVLGQAPGLDDASRLYALAGPELA